MTCEEYATIFQTYAMRSGYNKLGCLYEFKRGLNKQLQMKLETADPAPANNADGTTNSQNWIEKAVQIDRTWRITQRNKKGRGSPFTQNNYQWNDNRQQGPRNTSTQYGNYRNPTPAKQLPAPPSDPNAMDVDRTRQSGTRNMKDATCYHCQWKGHFANNCPDSDKPKVFAPRGARLRNLYSKMDDEEREQVKKDLGF